MENNRFRQPDRRVPHRSIDGFSSPTPQFRISHQPQHVPNQKPVTKLAEPIRVAQADSTSWLHSSRPPQIRPATTEETITPKQQKPKKKKSKKRIILRASLTTLALLLLVGGYLAFKGLDTLNRVFHGNIISDATAAFNETPLKGESNGRVNILLAGDSVDDPNHGGAQLTDSILLLSIDTKNNTAFLLSIPRDLWVYLPWESTNQKINAANNDTSFHESGYPSGGMGALESIVESQLGIPVDYYGLMDYGAFKDSVNAVGGVTINIQSTDPRGLYDPNTDLKLPNGEVTLNGQEALNLARARGDGPGSYGFPDSDFDRTAHQRQLFMAVAAKAKSLGVLANPVKISDLFNALGNNFQTDLSLQNVLRLIQITKNINLNSIQSYAFSSTLSSTTSKPLLMNYADPASGEDALVPTAGIGNFGQLRQYYQQLTSSNPVVKEAPDVVILNASDVDGLASRQRSILQSKGFDVAAIADANNEHPDTMIVDNSNGSKPNSLALLQKLYPGTTVTNDTVNQEAQEAQGYTADFVVILGQNWDSSTN